MNNENRKLSSGTIFALSATSGMMATMIVQPMDLVKTRMQLSGLLGARKEHRTSFHALASVARTEGVGALYNGLSAALFRQLTYTGSRLGTYMSIQEAYKTRYNTTIPFHLKLVSACFAGGVGAIAGTPAEVALIRMTADGRLPLEQRRGYRNVFHALRTVVQKEGVLSLWTGVSPTITRAVVLNAVQLSTYSEIKEFFIANNLMQDNYSCHFVSSLASGFLCTLVSTPIDTVKTRMQNSKGEFSGVIDVLRKTVRLEGASSLMKGFMPFFLRLGPHTILTFVFYEQLKALVS